MKFEEELVARCKGPRRRFFIMGRYHNNSDKVVASLSVNAMHLHHHMESMSVREWENFKNRRYLNISTAVAQRL